LHVPGGVVVCSVVRTRSLVTNGNEVIIKETLKMLTLHFLVSVTPEDFHSNHPLAGIDYQRNIERKAFLLGGGDYKAPIQLVGDFFIGSKSTEIGSVTPSYKPRLLYLVTYENV